jgi:dihydrofolate reductase
MSKITVTNHLTLDGVMQAPGRPDEDRRGGFEHGGWAQSRTDAVMGRVMAEGMGGSGGMLLGRRTYQNFADFWPKQTDGNPFTPAMNRFQKYVVSKTLEEPLPWEHSTLLKGEAAETVARLKAETDGDLVILGSGELVQTLMRHNLIDVFVLMIHPVVLGSGRRMFPDGGAFADLRLVNSVTTTTGVVIATYHSAAKSSVKAESR